MKKNKNRLKKSAKNTVLVISAHPDDEVLGVGGTIQVHLERGDEVVVVYVTDGFMKVPSQKLIARRRGFAQKSCAVLGVTHPVFLGYPGIRLDTKSKIELNGSLQKVFDDVHPNVVYTHHDCDINLDHRAAFDMTMVACRPHRLHCVNRVSTYETLSSTEWGSTNTYNVFVPNHFIELSAAQLKRKREAFLCYETEIFDYPHPRSVRAIEYLARYRGNSISREFVEAFNIIRDIQRRPEG